MGGLQSLSLCSRRVSLSDGFQTNRTSGSFAGTAGKGRVTFRRVLGPGQAQGCGVLSVPRPRTPVPWALVPVPELGASWTVYAFAQAGVFVFGPQGTLSERASGPVSETQPELEERAVRRRRPGGLPSASAQRPSRPAWFPGAGMVGAVGAVGTDCPLKGVRAPPSAVAGFTWPRPQRGSPGSRPHLSWFTLQLGQRAPA